MTKPGRISLWPEGHSLNRLSGLEIYPRGDDSREPPAILICPGGGYGTLAPHEGGSYALWLNEAGFDAAVLFYRTSGGSGVLHPGPFEDVSRAMRVLRSRGIGRGLLGVIGSSAGGHLAATLLVHHGSAPQIVGDGVDAESCRPDFGILCYPVINLDSGIAHAGSREALLGPSPNPALVSQYSPEQHVGPHVPPCFLWHTAADQAVPAANSLVFARALLDAGVPVELHLYETGGHGLGLGTCGYGEGARHPWVGACEQWLSRFCPTPILQVTEQTRKIP